MRLGRRLADAVRSPGRLLAFIGRIGQLAMRGDLKSMLQRVRPRGPTPAEYRAWRAAQPALEASPGRFPYVVLLDFDDGAANAAFAEASDARGVLIRVASGDWQLRDGASRPLQAWLAELDAASSWLWWITAPLRLEPGAAAAIANACMQEDARIVYVDHDVADLDGRPAQPMFKPAWDREQIVEHDYPGALIVAHASLAASIDAARRPGGSGRWGVLVDAAAAMPPASFVHVPRILVHLPASSEAPAVAARETVRPRIEASAAARGDAIDVDVDRVPWIRYRHRGEPVTIVIPTRDRPELLKRCFAALRANSGARRAELVVVDNGSTDPRVGELLEEAKRERALTVVAADEPFNFARLCNAGVDAASGRVVILLNNDTQAFDPDAFDELAALALREGIGAVGPLLLYPNGDVQSAGVLLGVNRTATSALAGFPRDSAVARAWCASRRRVSAVLGACLAIERDKYLRLGGLDEGFAVSHNEVDFCLRLEAAGLSNLFTPFARVVHEEGATRGFEVTVEERERLDREERLFRERWGHLLSSTDPAHHPCLARAGNPFALAPQPGDLRPRAGWRVHDRAPGEGSRPRPDG